MINVMPTQKTSFRAFGWVQDPSNFRSLCDVVAIFDENSMKHSELITDLLPQLVEIRDGRNALISALKQQPLSLSYTQLVGSSFVPRTSARCNGIVQATVKGQIRPFIGDWPADNFVRWAHALGFIKYNYRDDTFEITPSGKMLVCAKTVGDAINSKEQELLITAMLAYPPAVRILNLLARGENTHLTKFELGKQLGFIGEDGFTSLPQAVLIRSLAVASSTREKNKMKTDWDGSSDKYARMIATWLNKLGLVEQIPKSITVSIGNHYYTETIGQAYVISSAGIVALNRTVGRSKHKRIPKNVSYEMMATKGTDREYRRTRRSYVLKCVAECHGSISFAGIKTALEAVGLYESIETITDDVQGLQNIGLNIKVHKDICTWNDEINDFNLPLSQALAKSSLSEIKNALRPKLTAISHEYLSLLDLAYDKKQNRLFEMKTLELFTEECNYSGLHLGGSRKPDGVIYTTSCDANYGVIIDTKAYSGGYNLPISQADEMERYIRENQSRDININHNEWWLHFGKDIVSYYFMFVSGSFIGNFVSQLERISLNTGIDGTALSVTNLLLCADAIKTGKMSHQDVQTHMFNNAAFAMPLD